MYCRNCKKKFESKRFFFKPKFCCDACSIAYTIKDHIKIKATNLKFESEKK